ncbi:MAG TPA: hypothetical protein QGH16_04625 [Verrucomicrobiota bacterium]|jgi:hypothetical protein|nr:hypothetical protein [Verrucomicrobiota bacterium]
MNIVSVLRVVKERWMFGLRKKPKAGDEEHRYYLLPGMGRSNRRYRNRIQMWSIIAGIIGSALIGAVLWLLNR